MISIETVQSARAEQNAVKGSDLYDEDLGLVVAQHLLAGKWRLMILHRLGQRSYRFTSLQNDLHGIRAKMLSSNLAQLETMGLVTRHVKDSKPVMVEYMLTQSGQNVMPIISGMIKWATADVNYFFSELPS